MLDSSEQPKRPMLLSSLKGFFRPPKSEAQWAQISTEQTDSVNKPVKLPSITKVGSFRSSKSTNTSNERQSPLVQSRSTDFSSMMRPKSNLTLHPTVSEGSTRKGETKSPTENFPFRQFSFKDFTDIQKRRRGSLILEGSMPSIELIGSMTLDSPQQDLLKVNSHQASDFETSFSSQNQINQSADESTPISEKPKPDNGVKIVQSYQPGYPSDQPKFYWYHPNSLSEEFKPECREGASLTAVGSNLFLYGGRSDVVSSDMVRYRIKKWNWKKVEADGDVPKEGRAYHSAVEFENHVYIFGGQLESLAFQSRPALTNEVLKFDPQTSTWTSIQSQGASIEPRKAHAASVYDQTMIVYGGIDQFNRHLDDVWAYYLSNIIPSNNCVLSNVFLFQKTIFGKSFL